MISNSGTDLVLVCCPTQSEPVSPPPIMSLPVASILIWNYCIRILFTVKNVIVELQSALSIPFVGRLLLAVDPPA
jgi:hypothetical protein